MAKLLEEIQTRGMIEQVSDEGLGDWLTENKTTVYVGFDPTAPSLHLGHLVPILAMSYFQRHGHRVIIVIGGATGMIGDPSGKSDERNLLTTEMVALNAAGVKKQMSHFLEFTGPNAAIMVDNNDWIGPMTFIDWLRDVGKFFTVNYMVAKESVRQRMASDQGISFTEFSYMTMQAYDFLYLFDEYGCMLQCGGNDQWGNITAGMDLVRKVRSKRVFGMTFPLLSTASGEKFGKTAGNAVWLDPERTSPYQFYQYWLNTEDNDVERYLKIFSALSLEEIKLVCEKHHAQPERRQGQKALAADITRRVHGEEELAKVKRASEALFGGDLTGLEAVELLDIFADVPSTQIPEGKFDEGISLIELLVETSLADSRGKARKLIQQGGVYVNNARVQIPESTLTRENLLSGSVLVLRSGKKNYHLVQVS